MKLLKQGPSFRISFRATLLALMLGVLLTAVVLLGASGYIYAKFAVGNLGDQVLNQIVNRTDQHVEHALATAENEAARVQSLMETNWLDPHDHESATEYFFSALKAQPSLSYLSFGAPSGKYYHCFRDTNGQLSILWLVPGEGGSRRLYEFKVKEDGQHETIRDISNSIRTPPYERPYYQAARDAGEAIWTESYIILGPGESLNIPGVSRAVPIYSDDSGEFEGVLTADFDLDALSRFLRKIDLSSEGLTFLVEITAAGTPRIIAHPDAANPDPDQRLALTQIAKDGNGRATVAADQVVDPRVVNTLSLLGKDLYSASSIPRGFTVAANDQSYIGKFRHLARTGGPNWVICMMVPETEMFGDVQRMAELMLLMGLVGVLIAAVLSMLLSRRISTSLSYIANETKEIGQFRLKQKQTLPSRIVEIERLSKAVEEMKTSLRSFQKYVPSDLVRKLLLTGEEAKLGGERRELTIHFSDIVGFTSISEQLSSEQLSSLLSQYLDEMSRAIFNSGGTVDKYIGDGIMAFWGAPQACPQHAAEACRTALNNQARLEELRKGWQSMGLPPLHAKTGLHTGDVMVGNFGSPNRLDYTVIGDTVNVASRLESLNRIYGTEILISEYTLQLVQNQFLTRPIDKVAVNGREQGMMVHELLDFRNSSNSKKFEWLPHYMEGMQHYFAMQWTHAIQSFETVLAMKPTDQVSRLMIDRCTKFLNHPPGDDWSRVSPAGK